MDFVYIVGSFLVSWSISSLIGEWFRRDAKEKGYTGLKLIFVYSFLIPITIIALYIMGLILINFNTFLSASLFLFATGIWLPNKNQFKKPSKNQT